jgi:hypothetical protein
MGAPGIDVIPDDLACGVDAVGSRMITNGKGLSAGSIGVNWHDPGLSLELSRAERRSIR